MHELAKDYAGKVDCEVRMYNEGDSPQRIEQYGLDIHGMVVTDQDGAKQWMESGHKQTRAGIKAALDGLLAR